MWYADIKKNYYFNIFKKKTLKNNQHSTFKHAFNMRTLSPEYAESLLDWSVASAGKINY
jgi:hypothetical protein